MMHKLPLQEFIMQKQAEKDPFVEEIHQSILFPLFFPNLVLYSDILRPDSSYLLSLFHQLDNRTL